MTTKAGVGQGVEHDLDRLARAGLRQVAFGHVGLDFERIHVGHGHHGALCADGAGHGRDHVAHVGVLDQHHAVERGADLGEVFVDLLDLELRLGLRQAGLGGGHCGMGGIDAGLGVVDRLGRDEALGLQAAGALELTLGVGLFDLGLAHIGLGLVHAGFGRQDAGAHVARIEPRDQVALVQARAFAHVELDQPAGGLRRHGGARLRHHVARGGELHVLLRGRAHHHRGRLDLDGVGQHEEPRSRACHCERTD